MAKKSTYFKYILGKISKEERIEIGNKVAKGVMKFSYVTIEDEDTVFYYEII